jgi:hypothetical protein
VLGLTVAAASAVSGPDSRPEREQEVAASQTVTYSEETSNFPNPERGFYHQLTPMWTGTARFPLNATTLATYRSEGISLLRAYYLIDEFGSSAISSNALAAVSADLSAVRR